MSIDDTHVGYVDTEVAHQPDIQPGARATCYRCNETLIAKCGDIVRWHWAHLGDAICTGDQLEGAWHKAWKAWAVAELGAATEVKMGRHRADIVTLDGTIVELQSSYLDANEIAKRERQYGDRLIWLYRWLPGRWDRLINVGDGEFVWRRGAPSMTMHRAPVIWHHNDRLFDMQHIRMHDGQIHVKFKPGEPDKYGPVMYGSRPAPFEVFEPAIALERWAA